MIGFYAGDRALGPKAMWLDAVLKRHAIPAAEVRQKNQERLPKRWRRRRRSTSGHRLPEANYVRPKSRSSDEKYPVPPIPSVQIRECSLTSLTASDMDYHSVSGSLSFRGNIGKTLFEVLDA